MDVDEQKGHPKADRPRAGEIPVSWVRLTRKMGAAPLLTLLGEVDARGIPHDDAAAVEAVWKEIVAKGTAREQEIDAEIAALNGRLRTLRAERTALREARGESP